VTRIVKSVWACLLILFSGGAYAQLAEDNSLRDRVDASVEKGLRYLAAQQRPKGSLPGLNGDTVALPALAGMAFLSKGYLPGRKPWGDTIDLFVDYCLSNADMRANAPFRGYMGEVGNGRMYAHSIATLFLSEVSGMVSDDRQKAIDAVLPCAVKVILDAQNQRKNPVYDGGWRYTPNAGDSDLSCSGWALMALRSARLNGGPVPPEAIERAVAYTKRCQHGNEGCFGYQPNGGNFADTLSGAGILCLELCGKHEDPASLRAAEYLKKSYPRHLTGRTGDRALYGLYYTSQGLFQLGGDYWKDFSAWMYETWLPMQKDDGSFTSNGSEEGNPAYATSMAILAFTVPYRQLPIYQRDETVDEN